MGGSWRYALSPGCFCIVLVCLLFPVFGSLNLMLNDISDRHVLQFRYCLPLAYLSVFAFSNQFSLLTLRICLLFLSTRLCSYTHAYMCTDAYFCVDPAFLGVFS